MEKIFICLANSKKYSGRCLAGISVERYEAPKWQLCRNPQGQVCWTRPVGNGDHGAVPLQEVKHLNLLDIVSFDAGSPCPEGYQTENICYTGHRFDKISFLNAKPENLDQLTHQHSDLLIGNQKKYVTTEEARCLDHSIVLIKTDTPQLDLYEKGVQLRCGFHWKQVHYDLPVTDIDFHLRWIDHPALLADKHHIYLCVSLAVEMEGKHHKLVAGIVGA
jgi:hypothetical protein